MESIRIDDKYNVNEDNFESASCEICQRSVDCYGPDSEQCPANEIEEAKHKVQELIFRAATKNVDY